MYLHEYASHVCLVTKETTRDICDATHRINFPPVIAVLPSSLFCSREWRSCFYSETRSFFFNFLPEVARIGFKKSEDIVIFILYRISYASNYTPKLEFFLQFKGAVP